jgi:hypothetical protein
MMIPFRDELCKILGDRPQLVTTADIRQKFRRHAGRTNDGTSELSRDGGNGMATPHQAAAANRRARTSTIPRVL